MIAFLSQRRYRYFLFIHAASIRILLWEINALYQGQVEKFVALDPTSGPRSQRTLKASSPD
jgi:hypothetical protein